MKPLEVKRFFRFHREELEVELLIVGYLEVKGKKPLPLVDVAKLKGLMKSLELRELIPDIRPTAVLQNVISLINGNITYMMCRIWEGKNESTQADIVRRREQWLNILKEIILLI